MKELPYFMYSLLKELYNNPYSNENPHVSWKTGTVEKEAEVLFQELCNMSGSRTDSVQQLCIMLMGYCRYRIDARIWLYSMELLICKYCG